MDGHFRIAGLMLGLVIVLGLGFLITSSSLFNIDQVSAPLTVTDDMLDVPAGRPEASPRRRNLVRVAPATLSPRSTTSEASQLRALLARKEQEIQAYQQQIQILQSADQPRLSPAPADPPVPTELPARASATETPGTDEIERLNDLLLEADLQEATYRQQITTLERSLARANEEINLLEDGAASQLQNSIRQQRLREDAMADLIARFGEDAVPPLVQILDSDDARLRSWAAALLGRLGEEAEDAIPVLLDLADDGSADVRNAARGALDSIRGR